VRKNGSEAAQRGIKFGGKSDDDVSLEGTWGGGGVARKLSKSFEIAVLKKGEFFGEVEVCGKGRVWQCLSACVWMCALYTCAHVCGV